MRIHWHLWRDITHRNAGGAEAYEHEILQRLGTRGHDVSLLVGEAPDHSARQGQLVLGGTPSPSSGQPSQRSYRVVANGGTYSQYLRSPITRRALRRRHGPADVVVDSCNGMTFFSPMSTKVPTVALVHHVHVEQWRDYFPTPVAQMGRFLEQRVMPLAYRRAPVIAVSQSTADDLEGLGLPGPNITVATAGATLPTSLPPEYPEPSFLALGRLVPNKRLDLLLDMWANDVHPQIGGVLRIAGHGPLHDELRNQNVPGVEILGRVSEHRKAELLARSWFLVHTAKHEGWGLVINEASAAGRSTLGFNVPGVRDAVQDGSTGLLADDRDGFVKFWLELAQNRSIRTELGAAARLRASDMSWDRTADQIETVLRTAAA